MVINWVGRKLSFVDSATKRKEAYSKRQIFLIPQLDTKAILVVDEAQFVSGRQTNTTCHPKKALRNDFFRNARLTTLAFRG